MHTRTHTSFFFSLPFYRFIYVVIFFFNIKLGSYVVTRGRSETLKKKKKT